MSIGPEFYRETLRRAATVGTGNSQEKDKAILPTKCQFQDITELRRCRGQDRDVCLTSQFSRPGLKRNRNAFQEYAVILRRIVDVDERIPPKMNFEIQSERLRKGFRELVTDSAAGTVDLGADPIKISLPYKLLFYSRDKIRNYRSGPQELLKEMELITEFLENNEELREIQKMYDQLRPRKKINCPLLWTIYRPGELVVLNIRGITEFWLFQDAFEASNPDGTQYWAICGRGTDYDGIHLGFVERQIKIPVFVGVVDIESLPVVPLDVYLEVDREKLKKKMFDRGKQFEKLLVSRHCSYGGLVWVPHPKNKLHPDEIPQLQVNERVIVDYPSYLSEHPNHHPDLLRQPTVGAPTSSTQKSSTTLVLPDNTASGTSSSVAGPSSPVKPVMGDSGILTDHEYLLCPARIPGFALGQKLWGYFLIEGLKEVQWREGAFDLLEMDKRKKNLTRALIQGHKPYRTENNDTFDDIVKGKGNGLVFLLHGPPGLGKTLLAESISEDSKRPLYQVSSGELTNEVPTMEREIKRIFEHGRKWNAIVLLDEADVLMSKRGEGDLGSNAIVSVFLRLIEYYEGILFLTTNRLDHFDEAILNRVHLILAFEALTPAVRQQIWKNILKQNFKPPSKPPTSWTEDIFQVLGGFDVNGRTIKNLLRTASCYAHSEEKPLGIEHLNEVMQVSLKDKADADKTKKLKVALDLLEEKVCNVKGTS